MPNHYVTGSAIRRLRRKRKLTQAQLAAALSVSDKTVSKWGDSPGPAGHHAIGAAGPGAAGFRTGTALR